MCTGSCLIAGVARARLPYAENPVSGPACTLGLCVLGPCLRAGYTHAARAGGGSRIDALGARRRCLAQWVVGGRWSATGCAGGVYERVVTWWAGRHSVFLRCGVGHAWTLGMVQRQVALSKLLLPWQSGALVCCFVERWWITETLLTMRTLRVARS